MKTTKALRLLILALLFGSLVGQAVAGDAGYIYYEGKGPVSGVSPCPSNKLYVGDLQAKDITFGSGDYAVAIDAERLKKMSKQEIRDMIMCVLFFKSVGMWMSDDFNRALIEKMVGKPNELEVME